LKKRKPPLDDEGAATLAGFLLGLAQTQQPLTALNLADNAIGGAGGVALAGALALPRAEGCGLTQLNLSGNRLGPIGGAALGDALAQPGLGVPACLPARSVPEASRTTGYRHRHLFLSVQEGCS
jgi:hypothetical protein